MKTFNEYLLEMKTGPSWDGPSWKFETKPGEFDINKYLISMGRMKSGLFHAIRCKDNFTMSVQAGTNYACEPRKNNGPWSEFEVGSISREESLLNDYKEKPQDTYGVGVIFTYVPAKIINQIVDKHGGLSWVLMGMTPPFNIFEKK